jgi:hypothetical protein
MVDLVGDVGENPKSLPETLLLDGDRLLTLSTHLHTHVLSALMIATMERECVRFLPDEENHKAFVRAVGLVVCRFVPSPSNPQLTISRVVRVLDALVPPLAIETKIRVRSVLEDHVKKSSTTYASMFNVIKRMWYDTLMHERTPTELKIPAAASFIVARIAENCKDLGAIINVSQKVHHVDYNTVIMTVARQLPGDI